MSSREKINFPELAKALLKHADTLVPKWLPGGVERNGRWYIGDFSGGQGESANVALTTGTWIDNAAASTDKGGDLISLYARIRGLSQLAAARELMTEMGWSESEQDFDDTALRRHLGNAEQAVQTSQPPAKPKRRRSMWLAIVPVPPHAPAPKFTWAFKDKPRNQWVELQAVATWRYELEGVLYGYVARFERIDSKGELVKDTLPLTWCIDESDDRQTCAWHWKAWETPRPLYIPAGTIRAGLPVILVEGEKCAKAGHELLGDKYTFVSWQGGCKTVHLADWAWLTGLDVIQWPDCDAKRVPLTRAEKDAGFDPATKPLLPEAEQPGTVAMHKAAELLHAAGVASVRRIGIPPCGSVPDGWDIADAIAEGWTAKQLEALIADAVRVPPPRVEPEAPAPSAGEGAAPPWDEAPAAADTPKPKPARKKAKPKADPKDAASEEAQPPAEEKKKSKIKDWDSVYKLIDHFALIYGTDTVWDGVNHRIVKIPALRLAYGNDVVKYWLNAGNSRRVILPEHLVFEPDQDIGPTDHRINMWRGFELKPVPCADKDVEVMVELLNHLCAVSADTADEVDAIVHWILRWMALPLQKPGTKMHSALVFHGPQGTGKNLFFDAWRDLYGMYGITVGQTELEDKFNGWISRKLAIVGDEVVSRQEMYHQKNTLKRVVTHKDKFPIRGIQQETRWESNHANVVFLSNESQPLALEDGDRRYLVVYTPTAEDGTLYKRVADFLQTGGLAKWAHFLLNYPLDGFEFNTKPPMTKAKEALVQMGWLPAHKFAHDWLNGFLPLPVRVCSSEQLYAAFRRWADQAGEKFIPPRDRFTRDVDRWCMERLERDETGKRLEPRLTYKVVALKAPDGERKAKRCWLPRGTGPREGQTEGEWAHESVEEFDASLRRFTRRPGLEEDQ